VEVEQVPHLGLGGLLQGADLSPSCTVYQDIEAAMARHRLVDNRRPGAGSLRQEIVRTPTSRR